MGRLIYLFNTSLDGYVATADGDLSWSTIDDEIHGWYNERSREFGGSLYGRRLYETMAAFWPTVADDPTASPILLDYARIWLATPRVVFSRTLTEVTWNSRLARGDIEQELGALRAETDADINVGGATLAAEYIRRGLVDEYWLVVHPVVLGDGLPYFPPGVSLRLRLIESHRFDSGIVYLRYRPA